MRNDNFRMQDVAEFVSNNMGLLSKTERLTVAAEFLAIGNGQNQPVQTDSIEMPDLPDGDTPLGLPARPDDGSQYRFSEQIIDRFQGQVSDNLVQMVLHDQLTESQLVGFDSMAKQDIEAQEQIVSDLEKQLSDSDKSILTQAKDKLRQLQAPRKAKALAVLKQCDPGRSDEANERSYRSRKGKCD